jgi:hypothetical protein
MNTKELTSQQAVSKLCRITSIRAYSVNPELNLAQARTSSPQRHNERVRPVSLAQLSKTYVTAVLMRDYRRCTTYARAQCRAPHN